MKKKSNNQKTKADSLYKSKTVFNLIDDITSKKIAWEDQSETDRKAFSTFMVNRILSMNPEYTEIINQLQKYTIGFLDPEVVYKLYLSILPKRRTYSKYIKSSADNAKEDQELFNLLGKDFWWSMQECRENISRINPIILQNYLTDYGTGNPAISKNTSITISE